MKRLIYLLILQILTFVSFSQTRTTSGDAIRKEITPKFVNGIIKQFTISQLKTQPISNGDSTTLYYVTDAGKKGYFELDKNDNSSTGNDSTVIVTNNGKRLKRTIEQYLAPSTTGKYYRGDKTWQTLDKNSVGLSNIDNTSDANKPISTATQTALLGKLDKGYSISELRGLTNSVLAATQIFYCNEVGKEGFWKYDASDNVSTDNYGTILVCSQGGRIKRVFSNRIKANWFDSPSNTLHSVVFSRLIAEAERLKVPIELEPSKVYTVDITLQLKNSMYCNNATILLKSSTTSIANGSPIIQISSDSITISDLKINGNRSSNNNGTSTDGIIGILANQKKNINLINVSVSNTRNRAVQITDCPNFSWMYGGVFSCGLYGSEAPTAQADRIGILIDNYSSLPGNNFYMGPESKIENITVSGCGLDGIQVGAGIKIKGVVAYNNGLEYINHNDGAAGIYARPPQNIANAVCDGLEISECTVYSNTGIGIDVGNNTGSSLNPIMKNVTIKNNKVYSNYLHGIAVASLENCIVSLNICFDNGTRATLPEGGGSNVRRAGIGVETVVASTGGIPFKNLTISDNVCYDSRTSGKTQQQGLYIGTLTKNHNSENLVVINNDFSRNASKAITATSYQSPVVSSSILSVKNNIGANNYSIGVASGLNLFPINEHIYIIASSNINIGGIDASSLGTIITIENVSSFQVTLIAGTAFRMLNSGNLILPQNKPVSFMYTYETGAFVWKQIPISSLDITRNQLTGYAKATSTRAITSTDDINTAIGILEKQDLVKFTTQLSSGYIEINNSEITTSSKVIIQTKAISGTAAFDYTYDVSTTGVVKITARNSSGLMDTGCNSVIDVFVKN